MSSLPKNENIENDSNNNSIDNNIIVNENEEMKNNLDYNNIISSSNIINNQKSQIISKKLENDNNNEIATQSEKINNNQNSNENNSPHKEKKSHDDYTPSSSKKNQLIKENNDENDDDENDLSPNKIQKIISYSFDLKNQLSELESNILNETKMSLEETKDLNNELSKKSSELKLIVNEQSNLMVKLKKIKNEIDNKVNIPKIISMQNKSKLFLLKEAQLKKLIVVKDKEIQNASKKTGMIFNEYKKMKELKENNTEEKSIKLQKELLLLKNELKELENDIKKLNDIINEHKYCKNHKKRLLDQLELYKKLYQFEIKNSILIENKISNNNNQIDKKNKLKNTFRKNFSSDYFSLSKITTPDKKQNKYEKSRNNKVLNKYFNYIINSMKRENNEYYSTKQFNSNDDNHKINILFNSNENFYLNKIIPNSLLEKYKKRFDSLEIERRGIKTIIDNDRLNRKKKLRIDKNKIDLFNLKNKEFQKVQVNLNFEQKKQKQKIFDIKSKIIIVNKEKQKYTKILSVKEKENQRLKEKINELLKKRHSHKKKSELKKENHNFNVIINNKI